MTTDRQRPARRLGPLKAVMTMANHPDWHRSPEEIAELFEIAGRETEAVRQLSGCVAELLEVQATRDSLKSLTPVEVRAAREYRQPTLRGTIT